MIDDWDATVKTVWKPDATLLLHPSLPPALHGTNPRTLMGKKWWDGKRKKAYAEHDYCCWACGAKQDRLDAHEAYIFDGFEVRLDHIVALCVLCHSFIHVNRMNSLYDKGKIMLSECWEVETHGFNVLADAGFPRDRCVTPKYKDKDWNKWYLLINEKKFYSRFKGRDEWKLTYN